VFAYKSRTPDKKIKTKKPCLGLMNRCSQPLGLKLERMAAFRRLGWTGGLGKRPAR